MYVCVYVYVYVCMCECMYVCVYVPVCAKVYMGVEGEAKSKELEHFYNIKLSLSIDKGALVTFLSFVLITMDLSRSPCVGSSLPSKATLRRSSTSYSDYIPFSTTWPGYRAKRT